MTAPNCLYLIAVVLAVIGWETSACAEEDVTVVAAPATTTPPSQKTVASDGTPVVHKSLHKKKHAVTAKASGAGTPSTPKSPAANTSSLTAENKPEKKKTAPVIETTTAQSPVIIPTSPVFTNSTFVSNPIHPVSASTDDPSALVPTVETGLPVGRYPGMGAPIKGVSTYVPATVPPAKSMGAPPAHQTFFSSTLPPSVIPATSSAMANYSFPTHTTSAPSNFVFTDFGRRSRDTVTYPWKRNIITTMFWIGEGGSSVSSTDNIGSAWDEHWRSTNRGNDNPYNRSGYAPADHAPTVNTFYVALPFNDLAFPDKAREWLPRGWYRPPKDGKQVSACKDRWVEIKNAQGRICFAQWEDVGPLRYDHAEYVFGDERPIGLGDDHAGLDVSPAVAQYLGIDGKNRITSWRFVDDEDVLPGQWLRYDELALLYQAMHQQKSPIPSSDLPIQRATEPIDDQSIDSNKKKVDASKG